MALPPEISTVLMTASLTDDRGEPLRGAVTLHPSHPQLVSPTADRIIELVPRSIQLDEYGSFTTPMIPAYEPDVKPHGIKWSLTLPGESGPSLSFSVPLDVEEADIAECVVELEDRDEPSYLFGYRGPKGDPGPRGDPGPSSYNDAPLQARVAALESAGFVRRVIHTGSAYPPRPFNVPAGYVEYVGPTEPTDWQTGDTWVEQV